VIHNGIDLDIFLPRKSNFKEKNNISNDKSIILGVANNWEKRKGLDELLDSIKSIIPYYTAQQ
jgi:glycosyltransferase involved in cell wall biosynthesis